VEIDFEKLFGDDEDVPTIPCDIFLTLDKAPEFSFLRDIQSDVLDAWYKQPDASDAILKLNVGSGNTLVGLLILQSSLNAGVGPAVFVWPDNFLVQQVVAEAKRLGIDVTTDANDYSFRSGGKILIANFYKVFNGRSDFGVGPAGERIGIGSIVIDDAHLCLQSMIKQFRVHLPNTHPVYDWALTKFYLFITQSDRQYYQEIPFWSVQEHANALLEILQGHRETDELKFSFPFIAEVHPLDYVGPHPRPCGRI
jgi:hypothetical protein